MYEILLYRPDSFTQTGQASGKPKNMPDHSGNRIFDLKDIKTMITLRLHGFRNITYPNQLGCVALLAMHWASIPALYFRCGQAYFSTCPVQISVAKPARQFGLAMQI